jgi:signal peptidase II
LIAGDKKAAWDEQTRQVKSQAVDMLILILSFSVALLDQVTKYLIRKNLVPGECIEAIPGLFNISYVRNTGAAWGMLSGFGNLLIILSLVMLVVIVFFRKHFLTDTLTHRIATGLMLAGIVGNLIDRIRLGYVVDFLDFHWSMHHFPSFNVADSAICIGVGLYMVSQVFLEKKAREEAEA